MGQKQSDKNSSTVTTTRVENDPQNEIINIDDISVSMEQPPIGSAVLISTISKSIDCLSSHELLKLIFKKVDAIEDHLINLNVRIDGFRNETALVTETSQKTGSIDIEVLKELGLPTESQLDLKNLEANLKNVPEFKTKLVTLEFHLSKFKISSFF